MADEPEQTPIQNKYAQQYADDLAANRKEQDSITTQLGDLQERLEQLKAEEAWLAQAQGILAGTDGAPSAAAEEQREVEGEAPAPAEAVADVPRTLPVQRQDPQTKPAAKGKPAAKKAARRTTAKTVSAPTVVSKATAKKATGKKADGLALHELMLPVLLKSPGHPHTAREVLDAFNAAHPERATTIQTVRNTLATLVKKNLAEKLRQQGSVMFTATALAGKDAVPATGSAAGGDSVQGAETAESGKVPAKV
ncbi:hypothetical protein ACFYY1_35565 [Streptomyces sp. NPDC001890]|uniref:hypothetical protein n=1 Tax=Streptomyces sp. NPDC001890 TaxID=3364620 RepID=UPI00369CD74C